MPEITEKLPVLRELLVKDQLGRMNWVLRNVPLIRLINELDNHRVVDRASEEYLRDVARYLDKTCDCRGVPVLHFVEPGGLLMSLLQLGLNPDVMSGNGASGGLEYFYRWQEFPVRPFHRSAFGGASLDKAEIVSRCRPSLKAKNWPHGNYGSYTLEEVAKLKKMSEEGFPSLAQLAHDEHWYAIRNLCRRRVVPDREKYEVYNGKTAIEWVRHHGLQALEEEMRYLLKMEKLPPSPRQQNVEDELKEMVLLNVTKTQDEFEEVKKEVADLKGELRAGLQANTAKKEIAELRNQMRESNRAKEVLEKKVDEQTEQLKRMGMELKNVRDQLASCSPAVIASAVAAALSAQNRG